MSHLAVVRGDSAEFTVTFTGLPAEGLTDADIYFTVAGLLAKSLVGGAEDGITVDNPAGSTATITLEPEDTADVPARRVTYRYDVQLVLPDGTISTPILGDFTVTPDVTTS